MATTEHDILMDNVYQSISNDGWFEFLIEESPKDILSYLTTDYGLSTHLAKIVLDMYKMESYANEMNESKWK